MSERQGYICEKCSTCNYWDCTYECCSRVGRWSDADWWQICGKEDLYDMSDEKYYDLIIRDNTRFYMETMYDCEDQVKDLIYNYSLDEDFSW